MPRLEEFFKNNPIRHFDADHMAELGKKLECQNAQKNEMLAALAEFAHLDPEFPEIESKKQAAGTSGWKKLELVSDMTRDTIVSYLESVREENPSADLSFYALRDMTRCDWAPYLKACLERNPACIDATQDLSDDELFQCLETMDTVSIYDGPRLAQPDEVWNFQTGDGLEKAILLSNVWKKRHPDDEVHITIQPNRVELKISDQTIFFVSSKGLTTNLSL